MTNSAYDTDPANTAQPVVTFEPKGQLFDISAAEAFMSRARAAGCKIERNNTSKAGVRVVGLALTKQEALDMSPGLNVWGPVRD